MINRLAKQIQNMIKRAYVSNTNDDSGDIPITQISYMSKTSYMETIWPYGMAANAPIDSLCIVFNNQGQEEYKIGIASTPQDRFRNLLTGETCFGNPMTGSYIYFKADGSVVLNVAENAQLTINANNVVVNASMAVVVNTPITTLNGNLQVNGTIKATGNITDLSGTNAKTVGQLRSTYDIHTHNETGTVTNVPNQLV